MAYMITPGCTGPNGEQLALAAMADGTIVVQDASEPTSGLWWSLVYDNASQNFAMISQLSVESGTPAALALATASWTNNEAQLTLAPVMGGLGQLMTWDVVAGGTALAVRPTLSASLNLNVAGNGPYPPGSPVIAYAGWGGGQPNEIWTFQSVDGAGDYPWNYTFAPECAPSLLLSANPQDANGQLTIEVPGGGDNSASALQLWSANYFIDGITSYGVVFINEELSMALRTTPGGGALFCVDSEPDEWAAWLTGPGPDTNTTLIRSSPEPGLYWNASGAGPYNPGNPVISYPWQGGAQNEQWFMTYVPHQVT